MTIEVRRVYEEPAPKDGLRVLVDRLWPRGVANADASWAIWAKEVAPTTELRKWFGHDPALFDEFVERYHAELAANAGQVDALGAQLAGHERVTLLTATKEPGNSHAVVLRDYLAG